MEGPDKAAFLERFIEKKRKTGYKEISKILTPESGA